MPQYCFLCKDEGREQVAHRVDSRGPVCQWHFRGELHPEVAAARRDERKILEGKVKVKVNGGAMDETEKKTCSKCGKRVHSDNSTGVCSICRRDAGGATPKSNGPTSVGAASRGGLRPAA